MKHLLIQTKDQISAVVLLLLSKNGKAIVAFLLLLIGYSPTLFAQTEEFDYKEEYNFGVNLNTNATLIGGLFLKYSWITQKNIYSTVGLEVINIAHPKEVTFVSPLTNSSFTPYKTNYLIALRPTYGKEFVLFRKGAEEGVQVNAVLAGGPSFGLAKPYYILYDPVPPHKNPNKAVSVAYNPDIHDPQYIFGRGQLLDGLGQIALMPGISIKAGLTFEFGRFNGSVLGVEGGFNLDYYARALPIMDNNVGNYPGWTSIYLNIYYGHKNP